MVVVMIMRPLPDIGRSDHIHTENREDGIGDRRLSQYSVVLVIVENDKKAGQHHGGKYAAHYAYNKSSTPGQQEGG